MKRPNRKIFFDILRVKENRDQVLLTLNNDEHPDIKQALEILRRFNPHMLLTEFEKAVEVFIRNWESFSPETQYVFEIKQMKN